MGCRIGMWDGMMPGMQSWDVALGSRKGQDVGPGYKDRKEQRDAELGDRARMKGEDIALGGGGRMQN